jgi:hypothetical protein
MPEGLVHLPLHMEWFMQGGATVRNSRVSMAVAKSIRIVMVR